MVDIHLYGYNIHNWRYGGIESELRMIVQANMDLRVLYKTKITVSVYMRRSLDYNVLVLEAPIKHPGGVKLFFRKSPNFQITVNQSSVPMSSSYRW